MPSETKPVDHLIVGQGLAGSILALSLIAEGSSVMVVDQGTDLSASQVAAGIINPITGHRLNLTEGFGAFFEPADLFYRRLNKQFSKTIYQSIPQYRLIKNQGQSNYFQQRLAQNEYRPYLHDQQKVSQISPHGLFKSANFGTVAVTNTAIVDCALLLKETRAQLLREGALIESAVDYSEIQFSDKAVNYQGITAKNIIFCEGPGALNNPWLKSLPFKLSKGHVVSVKLSQTLDELLNWGRWLTPTNKEQIAKLGSNYQWGDVSSDVSEAAVTELLQNLKSNINLDAELIGAVAGVRPTTKFRQPFVGPISNLSNAYCLNGFGSKGCLLIPYYANRLVENMAKGVKLPKEVTQCL